MKVSHSLHSNTKLNYSVLSMQNCNTATLYPCVCVKECFFVKITMVLLIQKLQKKSGILYYSNKKYGMDFKSNFTLSKFNEFEAFCTYGNL